MCRLISVVKCTFTPDTIEKIFVPVSEKYSSPIISFDVLFHHH